MKYTHNIRFGSRLKEKIMKIIIAKIIWIGIIIACILAAVLAVVINVQEIAPYFSYPKTEAKVLKVNNYQKRSETLEMKYGSSVSIEYTVQGKQVRSWLEYPDRDSILEAGDIITIAYNPDNPTDCRDISPPDITKIIAFCVTVIFIAYICKKTLAPRR